MFEIIELRDCGISVTWDCRFAMQDVGPCSIIRASQTRRQQHHPESLPFDPSSLADRPIRILCARCGTCPIICASQSQPAVPLVSRLHANMDNRPSIHRSPWSLLAIIHIHLCTRRETPVPILIRRTQKFPSPGLPYIYILR